MYLFDLAANLSLSYQADRRFVDSSNTSCLANSFTIVRESLWSSSYDPLLSRSSTHATRPDANLNLNLVRPLIPNSERLLVALLYCVTFTVTKASKACYKEPSLSQFIEVYSFGAGCRKPARSHALADTLIVTRVFDNSSSGYYTHGPGENCKTLHTRARTKILIGNSVSLSIHCALLRGSTPPPGI
ncbi:unnamed protein product [Trichogramma brassicae]|uniref:Uncharacterized protein n=1 Tax=Trichogramma brassicae TaxID=86971 RepID=A0A6H5IKG4_9HYME|nr:unnamed protein product [Trichogramma brassicae]